MSSKPRVQDRSEAFPAGKLLLASLLLGGSLLLLAGILHGTLRPQQRADRLLARAQRKIGEIEDILAHWPSS